MEPVNVRRGQRVRTPLEPTVGKVLSTAYNGSLVRVEWQDGVRIWIHAEHLSLVMEAI